METQDRDPQTFAIIGAAMEVHRQLGAGFLENVYHEALVVELAHRQIAFTREVDLTVLYKGKPLACTYRADIICFNEVIVELKAIDRLSGIERSQVINYLKATQLHRALLINFGSSSLTYERYVL